MDQFEIVYFLFKFIVADRSNGLSDPGTPVFVHFTRFPSSTTHPTNRKLGKKCRGLSLINILGLEILFLQLPYLSFSLQ